MEIAMISDLEGGFDWGDLKGKKLKSEGCAVGFWVYKGVGVDFLVKSEGCGRGGEKLVICDISKDFRWYL